MYSNEAARREAEIMARVTGSRKVRVTYERVNLDGTREILGDSEEEVQND